MDPRELWERHAVLAQAFCANDEEVRRAQGALDEGHAVRTRTLAAFAVTLGSDGTVAGLLGLPEREVRLARRTVGKDDARAVAQALLAEHTAEQLPEPSPMDCADSVQLQPEPDVAQPFHTTIPGPRPAQVPGAAPVPEEPLHEPVASPAVDAVLVGAWSTGVDLSVLANELGLDLAHLVARARFLETQGRLAYAPQPPADRSGRHRRSGAEAAAAAPSQQWYHPAQHQPVHQQNPWDPQPPLADFTTGQMHDWDGILNQWDANSNPTISW
ncbi:hypothetical protein OHB13_01995 [Streptomyces sp. NBC_00440]|uniref:hypothetical protein n=1 Tax=unclassified Streptomyces TaxID=2593676 RepID=UPI002250F57C|nr:MULTISPECIES: hypothetical protein [unclassified Streptomyces]MCX4728317.1 hypothetical protein [Streptomyces sp. NBC_01306]